MWLYRVPGLTPSILAMEVMEASGLGSMSRAARILAASITVGRPPTRPRARAAASPSRVPETISSRMNSARAANTWKTSLPPGVVVSRFSCNEVKPTSLRRRSATTVIRSDKERDSLSSDGTTKVSPAVMNSKHAASCGRSVSRPDCFSEDPAAAGGVQRIVLAFQLLAASRHPGVADADVGQHRWLGREQIGGL